MKYTVESFRDIESSLPALIELQRLDPGAHGLPLAPDYDKLRMLDEMGKLLCVTARDPVPLVGYVISSVDCSLAAKDSIVINCIGMYVLSPYRNKGIAKIMIHMVEEQAYIQKADAVVWHCTNEKIDFMSYLAREGYNTADISYIKHMR